MIIPKQYLRDRFLLLQNSVNAFLMLLLAVMILVRLGNSHASYIVQYRSNVAIDAFKSGDSGELYNFIIFGLIVFIFHSLISFRIYQVHRQLAAAVLGLGMLLLVLALIVSNALLGLR